MGFCNRGCSRWTCLLIEHITDLVANARTSSALYRLVETRIGGQLRRFDVAAVDLATWIGCTPATVLMVQKEAERPRLQAETPQPSKLLTLPTELLQRIVDDVVTAEGGRNEIYGFPDPVYEALLSWRVLHSRLLPLLDAHIFYRLKLRIPVKTGVRKSDSHQLLDCPNISKYIRQVVIDVEDHSACPVSQVESMTNHIITKVQAYVKNLRLSIRYVHDDRLDNWLFTCPTFSSFPNLTALTLKGMAWFLYLPIIAAAAPLLSHVSISCEEIDSHHRAPDFNTANLDPEISFSTWRIPLRPLQTLELWSVDWNVLQIYFKTLQPQMRNLVLIQPGRPEIGDDGSLITPGWITEPLVLGHLREYFCEAVEGIGAPHTIWASDLWDALKVAWRGRKVKMDGVFSGWDDYEEREHVS